MNAQKIADFIAAASTEVVVRLPSLGAELFTFFAFFGKGEGAHKLAWFGSSPGSAAYKVYVAYVRDVIETPQGLTVQADEAFPVKTLLFRHLTNDDVLDAFAGARVAFESSMSQATKTKDIVLEDYLALIPDLSEPKPTPFALSYVTWSRLDHDSDEWLPCGVVGWDAAGSTLVGRGFPSYRDEAETWRVRFTKPTEALLADLDLGRSESVSSPRLIYGENLNDALERALFKYGEAVYEKTGRSPW